MCSQLRSRQDSFSCYRRMHLCCTCEQCGCREPWATRRPARVLQLDPWMVCILALCAAVLVAFCAISLIHIPHTLAFGRLRDADPLFWVSVMFWGAVLAAGIVHLVLRYVRDRRLRELPDKSFPIIVEEPSDVRQ